MSKVRLKRLTLDQQIMVLRQELATVRETLGTMMAWMAQSANSPLRPDEVEVLLKKLHQP
jgi:hypothetical protein